MTMNHTTEEWTADKNGCVYSGMREQFICDAVPQNQHGVATQENLANARLCAAAPDLLAALVEIGKYISEPDDSTHPLNKALEKAVAAVAKAEGRTVRKIAA